MEKKNVLIKIISVIISLSICSFMIFGNLVCLAEDMDIKGAMTTWGTEDEGGVVTKTQSIMGTIIGVIRTIGIGIAIIMLTYIAIKYMSASPDGKAEFKKSATGYIVGAVVLFATSGILTIIQKFATTNLTD